MSLRLQCADDGLAPVYAGAEDYIENDVVSQKMSGWSTDSFDR